MPIYGYACTNCGHSLDALQKIADDPLVDCPECEKPALKRQLSAPRFRLKGQGWYETDFKSDNKRNIAGEKEPKKGDEKKGDEKKGGEKKGDGEKSDTKSDTKAETKKETKAETKPSSSKESTA